MKGSPLQARHNCNGSSARSEIIDDSASSRVVHAPIPSSRVVHAPIPSSRVVHAPIP